MLSHQVINGRSDYIVSLYSIAALPQNIPQGSGATLVLKGQKGFWNTIDFNLETQICMRILTGILNFLKKISCLTFPHFKMYLNMKFGC